MILRCIVTEPYFIEAAREHSSHVKNAYRHVVLCSDIFPFLWSLKYTHTIYMVVGIIVIVIESLPGLYVYS